MVFKAFDRVWHKGLIFKLKQHGIDGEFLKWLTDYLSERQQKVIIRGCISSPKPINEGVPQGSVLGPLLFLIYMYVNDIADSLLSLTRLFADDSSLFYFASSFKRHSRPYKSWSNIRHFSLLNVTAAGACGYDFPCDGERLVRAYLRRRRGTIWRIT